MATVVCSNLVLDNDRLLLVKETKPSALGRWSLPGGRLEPGETLQEGAAREALEESGLVVDVGPLIGAYHCLATLEGGSALNFVFRSTVIGGKIRTTAEHPDVRFVPLPEVAALLERKMIRGTHTERALAAAIAGFELPDETISVVPASAPPRR